MHGIKTDGDNFIDPLTNVKGHTFRVKRTNLSGNFTRWFPVRFLHDSIDYATGATPSKNHSVWTLEYLHALCVVNITIVLNIITHTIYKEVCRRSIATKDQGIAVTLSLRNTDTWNVAHCVSHILDGLIFYDGLCHNRDRLRDISQESVGLGCGASSLDGVAVDVLCGSCRYRHRG